MTTLVYPDVGPRDGAANDGATDADGAAPDADMAPLPDGCVPTAQGEICNGIDDDCNGTVDDVPASKLASDVKNCGKCKNVCSLAFAYSKCQSGVCVIASCAPGQHNVNKKDIDGCEYSCVPTNKGVEICDNRDNDCNGTIDDGVSFPDDPKNCGSCGNTCSFPNAKATCSKGKCVILSCTAPYRDLDGIKTNGCEYKCPVWPVPSGDGCDGIDNDCNNKVDDKFVAKPCGETRGECKAGTQSCKGGNVFCNGAVLPSVESCNNKDDDCDGVVDNGFDKQNDPRTCGGCSPCNLANAIARCKAGVCEVEACRSGYVDKDKVHSTGCEYRCSYTGAEICDGLDNDCDGKKDNGLTVPAGICKSRGACAGVKAACQGALGWQCSYGPNVELKTCTTGNDCGPGRSCIGGVCPGLVASEEKVCDGKDGDCDGGVDDPWSNPLLTTAIGAKCTPDPTKIGICQGQGVYACNAKKDGVACKQTVSGLPATDELCNGLDDDCDGKVDEATDDTAGKGVRDAVVRVVGKIGGKSLDFYMYAFEASRPDSAGSSAGVSSKRSCSRSGVLPWTLVTYAQADAACKAAGRRLCSAEEWTLACQGSGNESYPYGATYNKTTCNGLDRNVGKPVATGSLSGCEGAHTGLFDLSGNVREWTSDRSGSTSTTPPKNIYVARGGAYHTPGPGLTCDFTLSQAVEDVMLPALGFRCCSSAP